MFCHLLELSQIAYHQQIHKQHFDPNSERSDVVCAAAQFRHSRFPPSTEFCISQPEKVNRKDIRTNFEPRCLLCPPGVLPDFDIPASEKSHWRHDFASPLLHVWSLGAGGLLGQRPENTGGSRISFSPFCAKLADIGSWPFSWWLKPLNHHDQIPKFRRTSPIFPWIGGQIYWYPNNFSWVFWYFYIFLMSSPDFAWKSPPSRWRKRWSQCIPACWLRSVRGSWPTSSAPTWPQAAPRRCRWGRRIRSCFCGRCMPSPRAHGPSLRRSIGGCGGFWI